MKRLFLLFTFVCCCCVLNAQNTALNPMENHPYYTLFEDPFELVEYSILDSVSTQLDSIVTYQYDTNMDSVKYEKAEREYDENGNQIEEIKYFWNNATSAWANSSKSECSFDDNSVLLSKTFYNWDTNETNSVWIPNLRYDYFENAAGNLDSNIIYTLNAENELQPSSKYIYVYEGETLIGYTYYVISMGEWTNNQLVERLFDGNGFLLETFTYNWDIASEMWNTDFRYEYINDANGQDTCRITYSMVDGEWLESTKFNTTYNAEGLFTEIEYYNWNADASDWQGSSRSEFVYDGDSNLTQFTYYFWDALANGWIEDYQYLYAYNGVGNQVEWIFQDWLVEEEMWGNQSSGVTLFDESGEDEQSYSLYYWSMLDEDWTLSQRTHYYYSEIVVEIDTMMNDTMMNDTMVMDTMMNDTMAVDTMMIDTSGVGLVLAQSIEMHLYPNPASQYLFIERLLSNEATLYFYDTKGQNVKTVSNTTSKVFVGDLPKGIYLLELQDGDLVLHQRVLIE